MDRERKLLACVSLACAALVVLAHEVARRVSDSRADERLACDVRSPVEERALEREGAASTSTRSALAVVVNAPVAHALVETPQSVELSRESTAIARTPERAGLLVDPRASDERLRDWYARATDEDLVRARFRLERLLELARVSEGALARLFAGDVDVAVVERELVHVASRLMHWPMSTSALAEVATRPHDDGAVFVERYARRSAEDLAIASWRVSRALALVQAQTVELTFACGGYAVVTSNAGWG